MMSQTGQHISKIHLLPNMSRVKGNQAMKFGQLVECNIDFMAIQIFQLNLTPTYSIYLLTTYYPQKGLNLLSLQRLDSYLRFSKF